MSPTITATLVRRVNAGANTNASKCYQCKRCSIGCPVAQFGDLHPAQIMRAVQLGDIDAAAASRFIWLCTGCETCTTRCPQGIDIAAVMDELRKIAHAESMVNSDAPFANVLKLNLDSMKRWGRMYEIELLALDKLTRPSSMMADMGLGMKMFMKGKISLLPERGDVKQMKRMVAEAQRIDAKKRAAQRAGDPRGPSAGGAAAGKEGGE
jgi:heterodisulfide reductase subunit C